MAAPYNNGYTADSMQRAPSPYHGYGPDPAQRAPSPYLQGSSNSYYDQHPQANDPNMQPAGPPQYVDGPVPAEGEKGVLGAIGGGITGGLVGKQTCHGFLGTVGGAIVGSLTEDWAKKKKPLCGRPTTPTNCGLPPANPAPCPPPAMYSPPIVDTQTSMSTTTSVHPGYWQAPPPVVQHPNPKPCGHQHHCGCSFFGKR